MTLFINILYATKKSPPATQESKNSARDETYLLDEDRVRCNDRFTPNARRQFFSVFVKTFTSKQGARKFPERSRDIFLLSHAKGNVVCTRRRYFHDIKWTYEILPRVATPRAIVVRGKRGHRCFLFKPDEITRPFRANNSHDRLLNVAILPTKYLKMPRLTGIKIKYTNIPRMHNVKRTVTILQSKREIK